jgi:hypothetical protein
VQVAALQDGGSAVVCYGESLGMRTVSRFEIGYFRPWGRAPARGSRWRVWTTDHRVRVEPA